MTSLVLLSVFCADRPGLVAAVADSLFSAGVNLRDATFASLGTGAEFTALCELPEGVEAAEVEAGLQSLPELQQAVIRVMPYAFEQGAGVTARVTHRITISGGDQLGIVARLADIFSHHDTNIVRLEARKLSDDQGGLYVTRFAVAIPPAHAVSCLAAIANTAGALGLSSTVEESAL